MAKAELKTKLNDASVEDFIAAIESETVRDDCGKIIELMRKATNAEPKMWGDAIIGFGHRVLKYSTGREVEWMQVGFSPRKQNLTLYLNIGEGWDHELLSSLGKHKTGMGCLYVKGLKNIDLKVLDQLIQKSAEQAK
jgi:hypothetical protein